MGGRACRRHSFGVDKVIGKKGIKKHFKTNLFGAIID